LEAQMRAAAEEAKKASAETVQELVVEDAKSQQTVPPPAQDSAALPPDAAEVPSPIEDAERVVIPTSAAQQAEAYVTQSQVALAPEVKELISEQYARRMAEMPVKSDAPEAAAEEQGFLSKYGMYVVGGVALGFLVYNYQKNRE
jgi:hypothetical protein